MKFCISILATTARARLSFCQHILHSHIYIYFQLRALLKVLQFIASTICVHVPITKKRNIQLASSDNAGRFLKLVAKTHT